MNRIITHTENKSTEPEVVKLTEAVKKVTDFNFKLNREHLAAQIPFIIYCSLLLVVFIFHSHRTEKAIREIDKLSKENKALRTYYISTLSMLMSDSKQSGIAEKLKHTGIKELQIPPFKITYSGNN